jgi:hypothetical protein
LPSSSLSHLYKTTPPRRRFPWRKVLLALGLLIIVAYVVLPPLSRTAAARRLVVSTLSARTRYDVRVEDLGLGYDLSFFARGLSVSVPPQEPFLTADAVRFFPTLWRIFQGRLGEVELLSPHLYLQRMRPSGGGGGGSTPRPSFLALVGVDVKDAFLHHQLDGNVVEVGPVDLELGSIKTGDSLELSGGTRLGEAEIRGTATLGIQTGFFVARLYSRLADLRDLVRALSARQLPPAFATTSGHVAVTLQGEIQNKIEGTIEAELFRPSFPDTLGVTGTIEAHLSPITALANLTVNLEPALPPLTVEASMGDEDIGAATWKASAKARDLPLDRLKGWLSPGDLDMEGALDVDAQATGTRDDMRLEGEVRVRGGRLRTAIWEAGADATVPFRLEDGTVVLPEPGLRADDLAGRFADFEWKIGGLSARGSIAGLLAGAPEAELRLSVSDAGLHDAEFLRAAQGIAAEGSLRVGLPKTGTTTLDADLATRKGELLYKRFYLNLSNRPASLRGRLRQEETRLVLDDVEATLDGVGKIGGKGHYDRASGAHAFSAEAQVGELGELFQVAVRDPLGASYPALANTTVGGRLRARFSEEGGPKAKMRLEAQINVDGARVESTEPQLRLRGLNVDLPVLLADAPSTSPARAGKISLGEMNLGGVAVPPFEAELRVSPNRLSHAEPLRLRVAGGQFGIERLALARRNGGLPEVDLELDLDRLDLAELSEALSLPPLRGTITGRIPDMRLVDRALRSDAEIGVQVFGGDVRIRNLRFDEIFSPVPAVALDAAFENISLGHFTKAFDVGRITGIVNGEVKDLVLVDGQPVSFEASMETVERPGVDQRISVTAVRQLSILGGAGGDVLTQGILSFFDDYGYAKMGFQSRLENDRFYLRGVKSEDGKEYLVVGSTLPPRVNVVSHSQVISFSEMVKRLSRAFEDRGEPKLNGPSGPSPSYDSPDAR